MTDGVLAIVDQGKNLIGGYTDDVDFQFNGTLPIILFGDHTRCVKYVDFPFAQGADGVKVLSPKNFYLPRFFFYTLKNLEIPDLGYRRHFPLFKNFQIPLPPLSEQERIVARLDSLFEKLDAAAEILRAMLASGELRRSAILHRAFTGELTESWREEYGVALSDWRECKLGEILQSSKQTTDNFDAADLKYVGIENIESGGGRISFQSAREIKSTKNIFHAGDLLYGKLRPYLDKHGVAEFDGVCSTDILVFSANKKSSSGFVNYFLSLPSFIEYAVSNSRGINLPRVTATVVLSAKVPLPPLAEQKEIARIVGGLLAREEQATALVESSLAEIATLKKTILGLAFRGELGTNDPNREFRS